MTGIRRSPAWFAAQLAEIRKFRRSLRFGLAVKAVGLAWCLSVVFMPDHFLVVRVLAGLAAGLSGFGIVYALIVLSRLSSQERLLCAYGGYDLDGGSA